MRRILLRLAYLIIGAVALFVLCCLTDFWLTTRAHAQNVEGQPIASQYGSFQVTGQSIGGFSFPPATCQVPAGGKNIDAFTAGVPIKIIDGDPTKTEIATPSSVFIGTCTVNMATTYTHQPPYSLTSGTGGLQEALINAKVRQGGPNTIILDANWYEQVKPGVAATVIAAAHGSTSWGLVDVTTAPYTYYSWNGSQYVSAGVTPPSGSAGGVLSGTYPNPGLATPLTTGKVVNGVSYSNAYPGSTLDVRVNACLADAQNSTNGNFSGICDSRGDGGTQSIMTTMTPPSATTGGAVTWILPTNCNWNAVSGFTGFGAIIKIAANETINGSASPNSCKIGNNAGTNAVYATVWVPSTTVYYNMSGFDARNTGVSNGSGATVYIQGGADNNYIHDISIQNYIPTETGLLISGGCCSQNYHNVTVQNNFTGGIPVIVTGAQGPINFFGGTFGHPGTGYPIFSCQGGNAFTSVNFYGWYGEPSTTDFTTVPMQISGCGSVGMFGSYLTQIQSGNSDTSAGISISNTFDTALTLSNFYMAGWHNPPVAVVNANPGELASVSANSQGILPRFTTGKDSAGTYNASQGYQINGTNLIPTASLGDSVAGNGTAGQLARIPANTTTALEFYASQATGSVAAPTSKTCTASGSGGAARTCTWSAAPVAGETVACTVSTRTAGTFSMTDSASSTYVGIGSQYAGTTFTVFTQNFYAHVSGTPTTTTVNSTGTSTGSVLTLTCNSVAGIPASPTVDGTCAGDSTVSSISCSSPLVTAINGDYVFCGAIGSNGGTVLTPGPGFTAGAMQGSFATQSLVQNPAGSIIPSMSASGLVAQSTLICASLEPGGATQLPFLQGVFYQTIKDSGTPETQEPAINLIPGTNMSINCVDNAAVSTDCTFVASSTASTAWSAITASTNTGQALILGAGSALTTTGTGSNQATSISTNAGTATGAVNVLAVSILPTSLTLSSLLGVPITFIPNLANTATTPTLTVNSLTATAIVKGTSTALASGDLALNTPATVIYNGTNFVLQSPVSQLYQTSIAGNLTFSGSNSLNIQNIKSNSAAASLTVQGGTDGGNATEGALVARGGTTSSSSGVAGNATLEAGGAPSTGTQGLATVNESFTTASALSATFELVSPTTTGDQVAAAALGSTINSGIAQTVGGTNVQLYVAVAGKSSARFDGTPVIGDLACFPPTSTGAIGLAHDNGSTACPAGQKLGIVTGQVSGTGSGATATVLLQIGS